VPHESISQRFGRQYGLLRQDRVENLNILVVGDNDILPYLLLNLAFSGVGALQGGVYLKGCSQKVEEHHIKGQFLLRGEDLGRPLVEALRDRLGAFYPLFDLQIWPEKASKSVIPDLTVFLPWPGSSIATDEQGSGCCVFGQLGPSSVYVGHERVLVDEFAGNVLGPALSSLGGAVLAQDVLRLSNSLRAVPILDQSIEVALRLRSKSIAKYFNLSELERQDHGIPFSARLKLGGEHLQALELSVTEENDEGLLRLELPRDSYLSRLLLDSVDVIEEPLDKRSGILDPFFFSLLDEDHLESGQITAGKTSILTSLSNLKPIIVGVGGLGTWVAGIFAASPIENLDIVIVDSDSIIEEHNLNRQVLYSNADLGRPKADAAAEALQSINPDCRIHHYPLHLKEDFALYLDQGVSADYLDPTELGADTPASGEGVDRESMMSAMLAKDFLDADVAVSCLDNMQSRWILNIASSMANIDMVNGGVTGFIGSADFIQKTGEDGTLVSRYGEGIKTDTEKIQCGGSIPIPSIVTTNALIGSVQAAYSLVSALGLRPSRNYLFFDGTARLLFQRDYLEDDQDDSLGIKSLLKDLREQYGIED